MKVVIQKTDLDTCLAAQLLGVAEKDEIVVARGEASEGDLLNPNVLCIEAGGSGRVDLSDFDHHNSGRLLPPACRQAYEKIIGSGNANDRLGRLVDYVCMVDEGPSFHPSVEFPSLSSIFSGMLLIEMNPIRQFFRGMEIFRKVLESGIDAFSTMPDLEQWKEYREAKWASRQRVQEVIQKAEFFESIGGLKVGYMESDVVGGIGTLYSEGCHIVILHSPYFGEPPRSKYTIAGSNISVYALLSVFDGIEPDWGGRETIIGSPRHGTKLEKVKVMEVVANNL